MSVSEMIRPSEAARRLGLSTREVLRLVDHGAIPQARDERRQLVVSADDVERLRQQLARS